MSGTGIGSLRVAQTRVGAFANRPKGFPVLGGDPPAELLAYDAGHELTEVMDAMWDEARCFLDEALGD